MGWIKAIGAFFGAINKLLQNQRDNELRKDGARETDLAGRDKQDEVRKDAKKFRKEPKPDTKSGAADRLRRDKGKS